MLKTIVVHYYGINASHSQHVVSVRHNVFQSVQYQQSYIDVVIVSMLTSSMVKPKVIKLLFAVSPLSTQH